MSGRQIDRREFLRYVGIGGLGLMTGSLASCSSSNTTTTGGTAAATTTSTTAAGGSGPTMGGTLRIGILADAATMGDPSGMMLVSSTTQAAPAVETLFRTDKAGVPVPYLATDAVYDVSGKSVTIPLRTGIKFHDDTDFNAEAAKWNLERCMEAKTGGTEKFQSIEVVDASTIRINLTEWDNTVTVSLGQIIGAMISPTAYEANGAEWAGANPVGTGPFKFVGWEKGSKINYERFDGYWQEGKPYLDTVQFVVIPDPVTRIISLRNGDVDLLTFVSPKDAIDLEGEGFLANRAHAGSGALGWTHDSRNPDSPFSKLEVRQAVQHAIDTQAIADSVFLGTAEATNQWIYKDHWGYDPTIQGYPYDPARAKELLSQAGFPNGFSTKLSYITNNVDYEPLSTAVQGFLSQVGIQAELDPLPVPNWFETALKGGTWEGMLWAGISPNPDLASALASRYMGGDRYYSLRDAPDDYVKAISDALAAPDFDTKVALSREAMKMMIDKYCLNTVVCCTVDTAIYDAKVHETGWFETAVSAWWTPENAWIG